MKEGKIKELREFRDFLKIFQVFKDDPFYEAWTDEQIKDEYDGYSNNSGIIFGLYEEEVIKGIITLVYGAKDDHPVKFDDKKEVVYLSDLATLKEERKKGIGTKLTRYALNYFQDSDVYKYMYLRTNVTGSQSINIFQKEGFEIICDGDKKPITQWVSFPRNRYDIPEHDERLFLVKNLLRK